MHPSVIVLDNNYDIINGVGFLPTFLDLDDPRPAREQFHENYAHGGGWRHMKGFVRKGVVLHYAGDPPFHPIAVMLFRDEQVFIYRHGFVAIVQPDESFTVSRMD